MKQTIRRLPVVVVITALLALGLRDAPVPQWFAHQDKLHHALAFAVFAISVRHASPRTRLATVLWVSLGLGIAIEFAQAFMPVRTASPVDAVAGVVGAWLGWHGTGAAREPTDGGGSGEPSAE